jgi:hypothetical protein
LIPRYIFKSVDIQNMPPCPPEKEFGIDLAFPKWAWG